MRRGGSTDAGWQNWGRTVQVHPAAILTPTDIDEVVACVQHAADSGQRVKAIGSGHSFSTIAATDGILVDFRRLSGIISADGATGQVRVRAGTQLRALNEALWSLGLAMPNLGDIEQQTISGAIATGTHGTGARFTGLASAVTGLRIVLADGSVVDCDHANSAELFQAARVGLGALGLITEVTLQCVPAYQLTALEQPGALPSVMAAIDEHFDSVDHFEFYWFPHTDRVLTKSNSRVPVEAPGRPLPRWRGWLDDEFLSNQVFEGLNRVATRAPGVVPRLNAISSRALSSRTFTAPSYQVFASSRKVRFKEMEVALPREALGHVMDELVALINRSNLRLPFPVEVRCAAADDVWLSTAYQRPSAYVAIHQYYRMPHEAYFDAFSRIVDEVDGRPHWGKMHPWDHQVLRQRVPRLDDFVAVRDQVDAHRLFANEYLTRILGDEAVSQ